MYAGERGGREEERGVNFLDDVRFFLPNYKLLNQVRRNFIYQ